MTGRQTGMSFKQEQQLVHCEKQQDCRESGRSLILKQEVSHDDGSSEHVMNALRSSHIHIS